jgi:hypothetical protein
VTVDSEGRWVDGIEYSGQPNRLRSYAELTSLHPEDTVVSLQTESAQQIGLYLGMRLDSICDGADGSIEIRVTDSVEPVRVGGTVSRVWGQRYRLILHASPQIEIIGSVSKAAAEHAKSAGISALVELRESHAAV